MLTPMRNGMIMEQLHYAHEVRTMDEVPIPSGDVKDQELKLAINLIEQLKNDEFKPDQYKDDVRERVLELIQRKVEGEDITEAVEEAPKTQIIDLMEALKASLARGGSEPAAASADEDEEEEEERKAPKRAASKAAKKAPKRKAAGG